MQGFRSIGWGRLRVRRAAGERGGGDQLELLDAAHAPNGIAQFLQPHRGALHQQDLERLVVLEEDVLRGDHFLEVARLRLRQQVPHPAALAAVDQGDGAGEHLVGAGERFVLGQRVADQFGDQLRTGRQSAFGHHRVELPEQVGRKAHAEPGQTGGF